MPSSKPAMQKTQSHPLHRKRDCLAAGVMAHNLATRPQRRYNNPACRHTQLTVWITPGTRGKVSAVPPGAARINFNDMNTQPAADSPAHRLTARIRPGSGAAALPLQPSAKPSPAGRRFRINS